MANKILMPKLSPTMEEGQISRWLKEEGDEIEANETIAEVDTDKATMEMTSLEPGTLLKIIIPGGENAKLGQTIGIIGERRRGFFRAFERDRKRKFFKRNVESAEEERQKEEKVRIRKPKKMPQKAMRN